MASNYNSVNAHSPSPYGSGDPYYNESSGFVNSQPPKKGTSPWIKFGIPVAIAVVIAAVVGGILGSRAHDDSSAATATLTGAAAASSAASVQEEIGVFPTATDSLYMVPLYPSTTNAAAFTTPTFQPAEPGLTWPEDPFKPSNPSPTQVRSDRPRLIAPSYMWQALPGLIEIDPYLKYWNDTIFGNATDTYPLDVIPYVMDSGNGVLDPAREIKMRIKTFGYAYRMTNDTKWSERAYMELLNAAGNTSAGFGPDDDTKWNPIHFLDTAELTNAFAFAYDWMYDAWNQTQKDNIRWTMITYGLQPGLTGWNNSNGLYWDWWNQNTQGNWNCVCNGGLIAGALAILGDDDSGIAEQLLSVTIPNALTNCVEAISSDGTWSETPAYSYFGLSAHGEMASVLLTAAGSDFGLLTANPNFYKAGWFHMATHGPMDSWWYGDNGVNRYSISASSMLVYGQFYNIPQFQLFQRDQVDVRQPFSMFWYNPTVSGAFWNDLALDFYFDNHTDSWASMRSSWTDENALYVGMKAGTLQGHQTHNDLDAGDFTVAALGTTWMGELGDENYLDTGYFSNDTQDSERWLYYRKRTEGQNCIIVNAENQLVTAQPVTQFDTTNDTQGSSTVYTPSTDSTAYFIADLVTAYNTTTLSYSRGIRMLNGRRQVLLQDDISTQASIMWRVQTNATINISSSGTSATLQIGNEQMIVTIVDPPAGAVFTTMQPVLLASDPPLPAGQSDLPNPGVTVLAIELEAGEYSLQVWMQPQWSDLSESDQQAPPSVPLSSWTLTSHN